MTTSKKTIALVTGGNAGIGHAVATQLARDHGYHVIIGSRNVNNGVKVAADLVSEGFAASSVQLDVTSDESIAAAVAQIERDFGVLDVLVNNAGTLLDYRRPGDAPLATRDLWLQTFNVNVFGVAVLTEACVPLLRKSDFARLVFVSSKMGSLELTLDKTMPYYPMDYKSYDASKAALNMLALNYVRILDGTGAAVNVACPGLVQTKLTGYQGATPEVGATRIVQLATVEKGTVNGTYSDREGPIPW